MQNSSNDLTIAHLKPSDTILIPDYTLVRCDRIDRGGGGVCVIIHNSISYDKLLINEIEDEEVVVIEFPCILANREKLILASYYSPLLGDLNAHHKDLYSEKQNHSGTIISEFLESTNNILVNTPSPTYLPMHRPNYTAIIDLAISTNNLYELIRNFNTTDLLHSDHITITLQLKINSTLTTSRTRELEISRIDLDKLAENLLRNQPCSKELNGPQDMDYQINTLTESISNSVKNSTYSKKMNHNSSMFLPLPRAIIELIRTKRKIRRQFQSNRDPALKTQYNTLTKQIKLDIIEFKQTKWRSFCSSLGEHSVSDSRLWKKINSIDNERPSLNQPCLLVNGILTKDPHETSNTFANELELVFQDHQDENFDNDLALQVDNSYPEIFGNVDILTISFTNAHEIKAILKKIRGKGSPGPDLITNKVLKLLPDSYHHIIADIINASIKFSYIPENWKKASVTMILKPMKNPKMPLSYRPISLLNTLSKIMERVIQSRMSKWCFENKILSDHQCGFRKNRQTKDHISRILQDGIQAFNSNKYMGSIFIDIEKAFDRIWHKGLLYKLSNLGLPSYLGAWIKNYLLERTFYVKVNGIHSDIKKIRAGVPQGSILGPLLFNIYFNSISEQILTNKYAKLALYADDLAIWIASPYIPIINKNLQLILNGIQSWMRKWRMVMSSTKSVVTLFNRADRKISNKLELSYDGQSLNIENFPKFLGITLDPGLHLHKNAEIILCRSKKRLNMLRKMKGNSWGVNSKLIIITYKVLIRSIIDYAGLTLPLISRSSLVKLETIQRNAIRIAYRCPFRSTCDHLLEIAKLDSIENRTENQLNKYFKKAIKFENVIIKNQLNDYSQQIPVYEGAISNKKPRTTILGFLNQNENSYINQYISAIE